MEEIDPAMRVVHQLRAVTVELDLLAGEFATRGGLHPTDLRALICLLDAARAGTAATPGWLGRQLGLNSAGTTALADRLERLALVRRTRDADDRRRVLLEVTERATTLGWEFFGPLIGAVVGELRGFDEAELAVVQNFLGGVLNAVAQQRGGSGSGSGSGNGNGNGANGA
ncbi:MarR family transcriptional regulator [Kitasatospora sp. NBC_01287]|uniref:MarR family transcriptional regulator n=1 Tax=Kitasatospora sp. NBC_01287 TaxID=2903573 RepID=UPI002255CAA4|nr:MarR family transcriptional regulator [Kitasatospora sp. NBC_01287]MCX4749363.1 MarR family transcriptional regulator [Kitasatospora sp. NBC_01287]